MLIHIRQLLRRKRSVNRGGTELEEEDEAPAPTQKVCWPRLLKYASLGVTAPPWRQPRDTLMVSSVNSHANTTSKRWHLCEINIRFALNSTTGWLGLRAMKQKNCWQVPAGLCLPATQKYKKVETTLKKNQGQIDVCFSRLPFKCYLLEVASVED